MTVYAINWKVETLGSLGVASAGDQFREVAEHYLTGQGAVQGLNYETRVITVEYEVEDDEMAMWTLRGLVAEAAHEIAANYDCPVSYGYPMLIPPGFVLGFTGEGMAPVPMFKAVPADA